MGSVIHHEVHHKKDNGLDGEMKLKKYLKNQLNVILVEKEHKKSVFSEQQKHKILESSHKKILKAYREINESNKNAQQQSLSVFVDSIQKKINDLVRKYVSHYKKSNLQSVTK